MTSRVHAGYVIVVELALLCETAQTAQTDGGVAHFQVKGAARKFTGDLANKSVDESPPSENNNKRTPDQFCCSKEGTEKSSNYRLRQTSN